MPILQLLTGGSLACNGGRNPRSALGIFFSFCQHPKLHYPNIYIINFIYKNLKKKQTNKIHTKILRMWARLKRCRLGFGAEQIESVCEMGYKQDYVLVVKPLKLADYIH